MIVFIGLLSWIGIFTLYFLVEFIINIFFTYKIRHVSKDNYNKAAIAGAISTFLFMFATLLAMLLATNSDLMSTLFMNDDSLFDIKMWMQVIYLLITTLAFAVGNYCATISIPKISNLLTKEKGK